MGKKRGGNKQQQQKPVEAAAPRSEEVAVVPEQVIGQEPTPVTKQPADLPEAVGEGEEQVINSTPRQGNDEELTPGGESPQGKKEAPTQEEKEEEEVAVEPSEEQQAVEEGGNVEEADEIVEEKKEEKVVETKPTTTELESPASTVEEKPLIPSEQNSTSTTTTTPAAEDTATTSAAPTNNDEERNKLINERIDQFFALPIVEFVGLIIIKLAVAVLAFALRLRNQILKSELFAKVQQTAIVTAALNLVDAKKVQQASVEGLDLLDSKVIVPLRLMDESTPQGKLFKGASLVAFDILRDAQKQVEKKEQ